MKSIQDLLDEEANLKNSKVVEIIRERRGTIAPPCFGEDDCSALLTHEEHNYDELTLQKIAVVAAFVLWCGWAVLVGIVHNTKSLFWFF